MDETVLEPTREGIKKCRDRIGNLLMLYGAVILLLVLLISTMRT